MNIFAGLTSRRCDCDNQWASPNVSQCQTIEQITQRMRAVELSTVVENVFVAEDRDKTVMFMPEDVLDLIAEVEEITNTSQPLLPNDISISAKILDTIVSYISI